MRGARKVAAPTTTAAQRGSGEEYPQCQHWRGVCTHPPSLALVLESFLCVFHGLANVLHGLIHVVLDPIYHLALQGSRWAPVTGGGQTPSDGRWFERKGRDDRLNRVGGVRRVIGREGNKREQMMRGTDGSRAVYGGQ